MTDLDAVSFPGDVELGNHTVKTLPTAGFVQPVAAGDRRDLDLICSDGWTDSDSRLEGLNLPQNNDEAIVVGAVGSGAPWFLSGWAEGTEVEFMIDTGCQVTTLATSVLNKMCADPRVRSRLCPCGRHLILVDSSPLMVRGGTGDVFPGLSCDMELVVASIGSNGLLVTEALQSCLPHQLNLRMEQLWADGQSTLKLLQQ